MRIRSIKPEFWRSKTIAKLDWDERFVLKGLESYVDDNGVGKDDLALIAADVFPRDLSANPRDTLARLSEAISHINEAGLIARYGFEGDDLLYIDKWSDIQRIDKPARGRFPRPDGTTEYSQPVNRDSYANPRDTLAPVTGEQGNRGTEEQGSKRFRSSKSTMSQSDIDIEFEAWWKHYPRKIAKGQAEKAFRTARKIADLETLIAAVLAYSKSVAYKDATFIAYGSTWLNGKRWLDEDITPATESTINDWLRECWNTSDVRAVEARCGLVFPAPDIPETVTDAPAFMTQARREWIKNNHDEIVRRILGREAS